MLSSRVDIPDVIRVDVPKAAHESPYTQTQAVINKNYQKAGWRRWNGKKEEEPTWLDVKGKRRKRQRARNVCGCVPYFFNTPESLRIQKTLGSFVMPMYTCRQAFIEI